MNNNQRSWMYAIVGLVLSAGGYLYSNLGLTAVALLAMVMSIYASDMIKRKTED